MERQLRLKPVAYALIVLLFGLVAVGNYVFLQQGVVNVGGWPSQRLYELIYQRLWCSRLDLPWLVPLLGVRNGCSVYLFSYPLVIGLLLLFMLPRLVTEKCSK